MEVDGGCLCGDITWRAEIDPGGVAVCHCTQCQVNGASAFQWAVMVPEAQFELLSGELKVYVKTAESGNERALSFCSRCGTTIHGGNVKNPRTYSLRLGHCRQREQLRPRSQIWCRSALPWVEELASVDRKTETQQGNPPRY